MNDQRTAASSGEQREPRQVERNIERTRGAIDRTLDEIGDRLHPQHLLHQALDIFRSDDDEPNEWAIEARRSGKRIVRKIKRNPIPALLIGAGAAWLWLDDDKAQRRRRLHEQWDDVPEHSGSSVDARTGEPYGEDQPYADYAGRAKVSPAWHSGYDWSDAHDDEASWTQRAEATLAELRTAVGDSVRPVKERVGLVANKMASLSGLKRSEIQRALQAQWDDIPEHSGSYVDARTGQPYDSSYGEQWRHLAALDVLSAGMSESGGSEADEDEGWKARAEQTLKSIQEKLSDNTVSAKERLSAVGSHLSTLAESSRGFAARYSQAGGRRVRSLARGTRRGAQRLGNQVGSGYDATRDLVQETMDENPLAVGIGVLGLGLLVGAMLPTTRREDQLVGEQADALKSRGAAAGREAMERGQDAVSAAGEAAFAEAERQGLTPSQLAEQARQSVSQVADAAKQQTAGAGDLRSRAEAVVKQATKAAKEEMHEPHDKQSTQGQQASPAQQGVSGQQSTSGQQCPPGQQSVQGHQPVHGQSAKPPTTPSTR